MNFIVSATVVCNDKSHPLKIQPQCPLYKFIASIQNKLLINPRKMIIIKLKDKTSKTILMEPQNYAKYLLEDLQIENNDIIQVDGKPRYFLLEHNLFLNIRNPYNCIELGIQIIIDHYKSSSLYEIVANNNMLITKNNTFKLLVNGIEIKNNNELLVKYGLTNGMKIIIAEDFCL